MFLLINPNTLLTRLESMLENGSHLQLPRSSCVSLLRITQSTQTTLTRSTGITLKGTASKNHQYRVVLGLVPHQVPHSFVKFATQVRCFIFY